MFGKDGSMLTNNHVEDTLGFTDGFKANDILNANGLRQMMQATENGGEEPVSQSDKEIKHRRSSKRNKRRSKEATETDPTNEQPNRMKEHSNSIQLPDISEDGNSKQGETCTNGGQQKPKEEKQRKEVLLPKIPSPSLSKSKNAQKIEEKYSVDMIEWSRYKGRRDAICYEMDPLFRELTSIIKYNLLVQHLEDIWMC